MRKFKTESKRLLDLMIHSIYTNKEIFLRELISNASDALDKLYVQALSSGDGSIARSDLAIRVSFDDKARTITVSDNGIGMDKDALEKNLGTIAHSGSLEFKQDETGEKIDDVDIIGQFGVGFYSAFMIADDVEVITRAYGSDQAYLWQSDGVEGYTITETQRAERGTDIIMKLRETTDDEDYDRFLNQRALENLIKRYSDYVRYPIHMEVSKTRELPKPEDAGDDYKPQYESYTEDETINSMVPIWTRKRSEVSDEEYNDFFESSFHSMTPPLRTITMHAEGTLSYDALLFIPSKAPFDFYSAEHEKGLALYSSNVMIMERCADLLPDCFGFVRGVVDSQDLSLNISRETLQHDRQVQAIERKVEKKVKTELAKMRDDDRDSYESFFSEFGHGLKYGIYSTYGAKSELLSDLLLFHSAKEGKLVTLDEYVSAMGEDDKAIFYASGDTVERLAKTPTVSAVLDKGHDVLLCTDDIDEFCLMTIGTYGGKDLKNVAGEDLGLETDEEQETVKKMNDENADLFEAMKDALGDEVIKVTASARLSDTPACITAQGPISLGMEKYFSQVPGAEERPGAEHVLEVNTEHPVFTALKKAQTDGNSERIEQYARILYNQALLAEGLPIDDPAGFNAAVCQLMS